MAARLLLLVGPPLITDIGILLTRKRSAGYTNKALSTGLQVMAALVQQDLRPSPCRCWPVLLLPRRKLRFVVNDLHHAEKSELLSAVLPVARPYSTSNYRGLYPSMWYVQGPYTPGKFQNPKGKVRGNTTGRRWTAFGTKSAAESLSLTHHSLDRRRPQIVQYTQDKK
jgi:hypothetical protein